MKIRCLLISYGDRSHVLVSIVVPHLDRLQQLVPQFTLQRDTTCHVEKVHFLLFPLPLLTPDAPLQLTGLIHLIPSPGTHNISLPIVNNLVHEGPQRGNLTVLYSAVRPCPSHSMETSAAVVVTDDDSELVL